MLVDQSVFTSLCENIGKEYALELLNEFIQDITATLKRQEAITPEICHRFKGAAGTLGLSVLRTTLDNSEKALLSGNASDALVITELMDVCEATKRCCDEICR